MVHNYSFRGYGSMFVVFTDELIIAIEKNEILKRTVEEKYQTLDFKKKEENFQKLQMEKPP